MKCLSTVSRCEYAAINDVLSGSSGGESRHESLLNTALLVKQHTEHTGVHTVYPSLNFTCSGVIHKLFLLGRASGGSQAPNLTVWGRGESLWTPQLSNTVPLVTLRDVLHDSVTDIRLYEQTVEIPFFTGDMLGFSQPNASLSSVVLQYQDKSGEDILLKSLLDEKIPFWPTLYNPSSMLPLIAIETSKHRVAEWAKYTQGLLFT